jgi:group I intron endonuclease
MTTFYHTAQQLSDIPQSSGIYKITCTTTSKCYIGSAKNLRKRYREHFNALRDNKHPNRKLQRAWNKHGCNVFIFEIIELVLFPELLVPREQYWIDTLQPLGERGYNISPTAGSCIGVRATPETKEKLRKSHLGQPGYWTDKKRPIETVEKMRASKIGKPCPRYPGYTPSAEHREKLRNANIGKKYSEETKRKLSEIQKGKKRSPEAIEKTRLANLGRKNTPEAIAQMTESHKSEMKTLIVTDPNGIEYTVQGLRQFCKDHNLDKRSIQRLAQGKFKQYKGWKVRYADTD